MRQVYDLQGVQIRSTDGLTIYGHLSYPTRGGAQPAVVYVTPGVHGGARKEGYQYREYILDLAEHFNQQGYVFCVIDKRGSEGYSEEFRRNLDLGGKEVDDVLAGTYWLLQQHFVDPGRVVLVGSQKGALTAALALARDNLYCAAVLDGGFYDLTFQYGYEWATQRVLLRRAVHMDTEQYEHFLSNFPHRERSPLYRAQSIRCPVLLLHGQEDNDVPPEQSRRLHKALQTAGREVTLEVIADCKHACLKNYQCWRSLDAFLVKHVKRRT